MVAHRGVHQVLVNSKSFVNIMFKNASYQLRMGSIKLKPIDIPLIGFTRATILSLGKMDLPLCLKEAPNRAAHVTTFMVMLGVYH